MFSTAHVQASPWLEQPMTSLDSAHLRPWPAQPVESLTMAKTFLEWQWPDQPMAIAANSKTRL